MVTLNGLKLTKTHPVLHEGEWKFPKDIGNVEICTLNLFIIWFLIRTTLST